VERLQANPSWVNYRLSSVSFAAWSLLTAIFFAASEYWFFLGGAAKCLFLALSHWQKSHSLKKIG
jgi:hypothetical protein